MRRLVALALTALASVGSTAWAAMAHDHGGASGPAEVEVGYSSYMPAHLDVLTGESVMWSNSSARVHTVTAEDGSFDSGRVAAGGNFQHGFASAGSYPYYCRLHPTIRGEVDAYDLLLDPQPESAAPGRSYPLGGRTALPAGTDVSIEADSGSGYAEAGTASVGTDGTFSTTVTPAATTKYRAVSGTRSSPPVELLVVDRTVRAIGVRHGRAVVVAAAVAPSSQGQTVVLQVRSRERFGWWPTRRARLGHSSHARFVLHTRRRVRARVVLTRSDGATVLAQSTPVVVRSAR
jgi:plastocyanin